MEIGDEILVKGTVIDIDTNEPKIKVSNHSVADAWYYSGDVESSDKCIVVPGYVKDDLDRIFKSGRDSYRIAGENWMGIDSLSFDSRAWIKKHHAEFMHALVYGYKAEVKKQYIVPVPKMYRMYYRIPYDNHLDQINNTLAWLICYGDTPKTDKRIRFTMDQIKQYGLEDCERVEVQDETK